MGTVNEKLYELTQLYQKAIARNNSLEKEIRDYEYKEKRRNSLEKKLCIIRLAISCFLTVISYFIIIATLGIGIGVPMAMLISFIETFVILSLEKKEILKKIFRKFFSKEYAELDRLNATLEKIDIEELQCQLIESKEKEFQCGLALDTFREEAERLANVPSEEDIKREYQIKNVPLEEDINPEYEIKKAIRNGKMSYFFQNHILTEEELNRFNHEVDKKKVKQF